MADYINIYGAKTQLSRLVDRAAAGEEIIIARSGRPVAKLVPLDDHPLPTAGSVTLRADDDAGYLTAW
jgi:prevent-host-death family protein